MRLSYEHACSRRTAAGAEASNPTAVPVGFLLRMPAAGTQPLEALEVDSFLSKRGKHKKAKRRHDFAAHAPAPHHAHKGHKHKSTAPPPTTEAPAHSKKPRGGCGSAGACLACLLVC